MRKVLTNAEMQAEIDAGRPVTYKGKILKTTEQLPSDMQILLDFPEYGYTKIDGNAKAILGYQIIGTPTDGQSPVFNGTDKKWEFGASGGGGTGTVNTGTAKRLAFYPSTGTTVDDVLGFEYDPTGDFTFLSTTVSGKTGFVVKQLSSTPPALTGSPSLLHIHALNGSDYWAAKFTSDDSTNVWTNYLDSDGSYNLTGVDSGLFLASSSFSYYTDVDGAEWYFYPKGLEFASLSATYWGGIGEIASDHFGLMLTTDTPSSGAIFPLTWRNTGITQHVPATALSDGNIPNNHLHFFIDEPTDTLRVKWKESGGTVLSSILITSASGMTGSGSLVFATSPTITTPLLSGAVVQTSNSATAFESGPNGSTNPVFRLVNNVASQATGLSITGNVSGSGVTLTALSSVANEAINIIAKGTANINLTATRVATTTFQATSAFITANNSPIRLGLSSLLTWGNNSDSTVGVDLYLRRVAGANLALGNVDAASPVSQILSAQGSRGGTDSNVSGGNLSIISGLGTGNSTPSSLILQSPLIGSSGTAAQVATTGLTILNGTAKLTSYTVSGLPSASVCGAGATAFVTDANASLTSGIGTTVAGGGSNKVPVYSDGTNWIIG